PAIRPPISAAAASLIRPTAAWAAIPATGKLTKATVHSSQLLTLKRRGSPLACPGTGVAALPVRLRVALVSVVMGCPRWFRLVFSSGFCFWNSVGGGRVWAVCGRYGGRVE